MNKLLADIRQCRLCQSQLPQEAKPILQAVSNSKILIAGQAPGLATHNKGIPFDDKSGDRLRLWLGVDKTQFYSPELFAIIPMGFCFPGSGKSGDLPPIPKCADTWRQPLMTELKHLQLTIVIGQYAIKWHLPEVIQQQRTITPIIKQWQQLLEKDIIALPHPSPRNNIWLKKNPWFEVEVLPLLKNKVSDIISSNS